MNNHQFIKARLNQMKKDVINLQNQIDHLQNYLDKYINFIITHAPSD